ncbi:FecCD family ABC transporter permease [Methylobrevis pamukkalensis]|uniref:Iron-uptake system permease protein FeuC n=1 Tax=Methylobrevis pamukkalensis TaxID=1439726 RepID=A0A1E3H747_9HYPH|nr:Iron-uptake system permease protein FeuC [Methylobrevis pamukkalensis]
MIRLLLVLAASIALLAVVGLVHGDYPVPLGEVLGALAGDPAVPAQVSLIVTELRLPRLVLAVLVGLALGVAGTLSQAVMRNPLAEPGLLGINAGAGLAAMVVLVGVKGVSDTWLPAASFVGAAVMALAIMLLSWRGGTSSIRIILIGIGLSSLGGAATSFLTAFGDVRDVQRAMVWLAGSVYDGTWSKVEALLLWSVPCYVFVWMSARELDTIGFGDDTARSLGQRSTSCAA